MANPVKLVIFDFDDTLVHLGIPWKDVKADVLALAKHEGISISASDHLVQLGNAISLFPGGRKKVDAIYAKYEKECVATKSYRTFPEMLTLAKELSDSGIILAVASGNLSSTIGAVLAKARLRDRFVFICGRDSVARNKPDPEQLLLILERTGIPKEDAFFVGDSKFDEEAAKGAGVRFFRLKDSQADPATLRGILLRPKG